MEERQAGEKMVLRPEPEPERESFAGHHIVAVGLDDQLRRTGGSRRLDQDGRIVGRDRQVQGLRGRRGSDITGPD